MDVAIVALPMTLIIITGEIDLSVESMIGLSGAILGWLWAAGFRSRSGSRSSSSSVRSAACSTACWWLGSASHRWW